MPVSFLLLRHDRTAKKLHMETRLAPLVCLAALLSGAGILRAQPAPDNGQIQRGKYLVERVGLCADCHTPKTDSGDYDRTAWLQGDVVDFKPLTKRPFAAVAPMIAGLPTFPKDEQAVKFFETGTNASGKLALSPMPQFRFDHDDAVAVVSYLRSLKK